MKAGFVLLLILPASLFGQSVDEGAPPLSASEKFRYHGVRVVEPREFLRCAIAAGLQQIQDNPHEWGQGAEGYAKRYGSAYGYNAVRQSVAFALDTTFHQDPRYFRSQKPDVGGRVRDAVLQTLVSHTDSGHRTFALWRVGSALAAGLVANTWQPKSLRDSSDAVTRSAISLGTDTASNVFREFWPDLKKRFPARLQRLFD